MWLVSTKQRPEEGETSLATEPFQLFLANMVETAHCHLQIHCHAKPRQYTTAHILTFLVAFHNILLPPESIIKADHQRNWYIVVWDNTPSASGAVQPTKLCISEPPYESSWCWAYERQPFVCMPLVQAVEKPCGEIDMGWMRRSRHFFPWCLAREDGACDVDEALWPDPPVQHHAA